MKCTNNIQNTMERMTVHCNQETRDESLLMKKLVENQKKIHLKTEQNLKVYKRSLENKRPQNLLKQFCRKPKDDTHAMKMVLFKQYLQMVYSKRNVAFRNINMIRLYDNSKIKKYNQHLKANKLVALNKSNISTETFVIPTTKCLKDDNLDAFPLSNENSESIPKIFNTTKVSVPQLYKCENIKKRFNVFDEYLL